jgi:hypothetical protein
MSANNKLPLQRLAMRLAHAASSVYEVRRPEAPALSMPGCSAQVKAGTALLPS